MDECVEFKTDLVQVLRLALHAQPDDVRLFAARMVRRYRRELPELARQIDEQLKSKPQRTGSALRKALDQGTSDSQFPMDSETNLCLLRVCEQDRKCPRPLLSPELDALLAQLLHERKHVDTLAAVGLDPSKSAILVGPPGVGKTLTAQWVAEQLDMPFYILDLSAVMSSLLGKSGSNIRAAFDFAKKSPCVLLLDEIDSIAKKRSDDSDVGELKRLVTVILQEIDSWPSSSLLIAATNHRELIDPALWRRFDVIAEFKTPTDDAIFTAVQRFLGPDLHRFGKWKDILSIAMRGNSFSDVEREILKLRRAAALGLAPDLNLVVNLVKERLHPKTRDERRELAKSLIEDSTISQHRISDITGISRDTLRKYSRYKKNISTCVAGNES